MSESGGRGIVRTVLGDVPVAPWGVTNAHVHLIVDICAHHHDDRYVDYRLDLNDTLAETREYAAAGGHCLVDVTPIALGRDPEGLRQAAQQTGVAVVAGTGIYHELFHPPEIAALDADGIADLFAREIEQGMDGTDVRAGIIGEIGTLQDAITPREEAVFRGAARAALRTGAAVTTHTYFGKLAQEQIDILESEGLPPERIVIGHLDDIRPIDLDIIRAIVDRGAFAQLDAIGCSYWSEALNGHLPTDDERVNALVQLADEGRADRLIVGSDLCRRRHLRSAGGPGFAHLADGFRTLALRGGLPDSLLQLWMVDNPAALLELQ